MRLNFNPSHAPDHTCDLTVSKQLILICTGVTKISNLLISKLCKHFRTRFATTLSIVLVCTWAPKAILVQSMQSMLPPIDRLRNDGASYELDRDLESNIG